MTYTITEPCIDVKDQSCVEVCPVDCIHADDEDRILYISPDECIDCGACEPACPVTAIFAEDDVPEEWNAYTEINALWFEDKTGRARKGGGARSLAAGGPPIRNARRRRAGHSCLRPRCSGRPRLQAEAISHRLHEIIDRDAVLGLRVPIADGDGAVVQGVEVHRDAERRADLILPAVAAADALRLVVLRGPVGAEAGPDLLGQRIELGVAAEREHGNLEGRDAGVEFEDGAVVAFFVRLHVVGVGEEGESGTIDARGGSMTYGTMCSLASWLK